MCNRSDDEGETVMLSERCLEPSQGSCRVCQNEGQVKLRRKFVYCKNCFLSYCTHKFRATLGKSKKLKPGDRILAVFTGGHSSVALLHFLRSGLNEERSKRFVFDVDVLYIYDQLLFGKSVEEGKKILEQVKEKVKNFGFNLLITSVAEFFNEVSEIGEHTCFEGKNIERIQKVFDQIRTITTMEDTLYNFKKMVTMNVASHKNYNYVFSDEIATDLAIKLLSGIATGRGDVISAEVGFCDDLSSVPSIKIQNFESLLRPMKEFMMKEIVFYNIFHKLESIPVSSFKSSKANLGPSIRGTAEKFILGLQDEFPSTIHTICSTGSKLNIDKNCLNDSYCELCAAARRTKSEDMNNTVDALNFSWKMSNVGSRRQGEDVALCYACQRLFNEMGDDAAKLLWDIENCCLV